MIRIVFFEKIQETVTIGTMTHVTTTIILGTNRMKFIISNIIRRFVCVVRVCVGGCGSSVCVVCGVSGGVVCVFGFCSWCVCVCFFFVIFSVTVSRRFIYNFDVPLNPYNYNHICSHIFNYLKTQ